jgi:hypothetical protein
MVQALHSVRVMAGIGLLTALIVAQTAIAAASGHLGAGSPGGHRARNEVARARVRGPYL